MKASHRRIVTFFAASALIALGVTALVSTPASAHDDDHKRVQGQKLKIRWDALRSDRSRFLFKTKNQTRINDLSADPRVVGATLTIRGTGLTDGDTGVIHLIDGPEGRWSPIGDKGWQYKYGHDFNDSYGITNVKMKENVKKGGSLIIKGKGQFFDYDIFDAQDTVDVSLSIGIDVYCAQFGQNQGELVRNEMGKVDGKSSDPPADCAVICGNGILELGEECDDGNTVDNDTCANDCSGCLPQDVEFNSTFEGIQALIFDSPVYDCSNDTCHGGSSQGGGLDLRDANSYAQLVNVSASNPSNGLRVFPGDQDLSYLYNKIAAKTLGAPTNVGTPMPANPETVPENLLEALRLWIRGGAPETGVVVGTAELFGSCLPPAAPLKIPQPDDPDYVVPCPGVFPGTNPSGNCFAWNYQQLAQDPQSHHSIIHIYAGGEDVDHTSWGPWECYEGPRDGLPCDPVIHNADPDDPADGCTSAGVCGGRRRDTTACIGFGPPDWGFANNNAPQFSGAQESTVIIDYPDDVYQLLPLRGIIGWNSHAFNLTASDMQMEAWLNLDYAGSAERTYLAGALFNADQIFTQDVLPYEQEEYCYTHTFEQGTHLFELSSHMHSAGIRFRYYLPPNNPCANTNNCNPGPPSDIFYESTDYSDAVQMLEFFGNDEWVFDSPNDADRTLKFCALYDNGFTDPATVKRRSTSECPANGCGPIPGGPCGSASMTPKDPTNTTIYCLDGPDQGKLCPTADMPMGANANDWSDCPGSVCDACRQKGGVTTGDEMFIALGNFYVVP
jgi:cysteine-rich repeat protein